MASLCATASACAAPRLAFPEGGSSSLSPRRLPGALRHCGSRSLALGPTVLRHRGAAGSKGRRGAVAAVGAQAQESTQYVTSPEVAKELVDQGYTVLDVRDPTQWERARISGSVHVPAYILNEDTDVGTLIARQAHQNFAGNLYGLAFTKVNPNFFEEIKAKFPNKDAKLLLVCQEGLRANSVADKLEDQGYTSLALLEGGLNGIPPGLFPKEGSRELKDAGKGGFTAIQTQFSVVLATILIASYLFLEFFPDAAQDILRPLYQ